MLTEKVLRAGEREREREREREMTMRRSDRGCSGNEYLLGCATSRRNERKDAKRRVRERERETERLYRSEAATSIYFITLSYQLGAR